MWDDAAYQIRSFIDSKVSESSLIAVRLLLFISQWKITIVICAPSAFTLAMFCLSCSFRSKVIL